MSELTVEKIIKIVHTLANTKWSETDALDMFTNAVNFDRITEKQYRDVITQNQRVQIGSCGSANSNHVDRNLENEGTRNYGSWEIMEIMVKYGDLPGTFMALKHILRKPKTEFSLDVKNKAGLTRTNDIKKAITYLQREVDIAEGRYKPTIK
jgi:hypothetical protein